MQTYAVYSNQAESAKAIRRYSGSTSILPVGPTGILPVDPPRLRSEGQKELDLRLTVNELLEPRIVADWIPFPTLL